MGAAAMRYPLVIDHLASVVESCMGNDLRVAVPEDVAPNCPALAAMLDDAGFDGRMNVKRAAFGEEAADIVGKPQGRKNIGHVDRKRTAEVAFGVHERNCGRQSVIAEGLQGLARQLTATIQIVPFLSAGVVRINFKRSER